MHKRAIDGARKALLLESWERLVIAWVVTITALVVIWFIGGEPDARGELITKLAAGVAVAAVFPIVYVLKFLRAPAEMEAEAVKPLNGRISELEATNARLQQEGRNRGELEHTASAISILIERGCELGERRIKIEEFDGWRDEEERWNLQSLIFLRTVISHQEAVRFKFVTVEMRRNYVFKVHEEHNQRITAIDARVSILREINESLRDYWLPMVPQRRHAVEAFLDGLLQATSRAPMATKP